jgi:hypothetical protein
MIRTRIALLAFALFLGGCRFPSRLQPAAVQALRLPEQRVTFAKRVLTIPAGTYDAVYQGSEGTYFKAPGSIMQTQSVPPPQVPASLPGFLHGGIFIPKPDAKEQRHAVWIYTPRVVPFVGKLVETRPLELIFLNEKLVYE